MLKCFWILLCLSLFILIASFLLYITDVGTLACNWIIHNIFYLSSENGLLWQIWEEPKNPDGGKIHSNFDFFIWNITNPAEVAKGLNPKLAEIGPYCFMNFVKKVDIREENDSVFYRNKQKFVARRDPKCAVTGKESIYHVNVPYLVFEKRVAMMDMFTRSLARSFIPSGWSLIQKHSIEEVIWGYTDPVLERLKTFGQTDQTVFGFFMNQNESKSFEIEAISGKKNVKDTGKISSWNGRKDLSDVWFTADAYTLQGSDSNSPMVPPLANASRLDVFVDLLCRSLYFERTEQSRVNKIKVDVYNVPLDELKKENNRGYWKKGLTNRDGMIDLSSCMKLTFGESAPLIASLPHFLYAAKNYKNLYNLRPSIEEHSSFIKVEPMTGIILEAAKRFQLNTFVSRNFHPGKPANNSIIPAFWLSQSFSAVDHPGLLTKLGQQIRWLILVTNFPLVLLVIAICGNLAAVFIGFKIHSQARQPRRSQARSLKEIGQLDGSSNETLERQNLTTIS